MEKLLTMLKNTQILACVAIGLLLVAALAFIFSSSPTRTYSAVEQELLELSGNIRNNYMQKPDYRGLNNQKLITDNIIPNQLLRNNKIMSSIGKEYIIGQNGKGDVVMPSQRTFMITLNNLNKKACQDIAMLQIGNEDTLSLQKVIINNASETFEFEWGSTNSLPISVNKANEVCASKNNISWVFE